MNIKNIVPANLASLPATVCLTAVPGFVRLTPQ